MGASASREKFRESVSALIEVDVASDDADFWDELWKIPSSPEEVFELIPPHSARRLRDERFDNLATLFTQATAQLCQIVETPYNIYFDQALNCVRVLTRILPFLLEKGMFFHSTSFDSCGHVVYLRCVCLTCRSCTQVIWVMLMRMSNNSVGGPVAPPQEMKRLV